MTAPLLAIVGPTAVGKTALALDVARRWGAELVGADASQIYRGLDAGTGKARAEELGEVRHHLLDVAAPDEAFDAATYARLADAAIFDIQARGRRVVLCGGTGLYLRALVTGLCEAPPVDEGIRAELQRRLREGEGAALHAELAAVDAPAAARIAPADHPRLERALGVWRTTGRTLTDWQRSSTPAAPRHEVRWLGLTLSRPVLAERIEARTRRMFLEGGLIDEVRRLEDAGFSRHLRSMQALGYRQASAVAHGEMSVEAAIEETIRSTRQYAKRQETWFRAVPGVTWRTPPVDPAWLDGLLTELWGPP